MVKSLKHRNRKRNSKHRFRAGRKNKKSHYKNTRKWRRGGGCGCNSNAGLWGASGGDSVASFNENLPANSHYSLNNYTNDPNNSNFMTSSRNIPDLETTNYRGGRSRRGHGRRGKKSKKQVRISDNVEIMKGGGFSDFFFGSNPGNAFLSSMSSPGVLDSYNNSRMQIGTNSAAYVQPALRMYSDANPPLA